MSQCETKPIVFSFYSELPGVGPGVGGGGQACLPPVRGGAGAGQGCRGVHGPAQSLSVQAGSILKKKIFENTHGHNSETSVIFLAD